MADTLEESLVHRKRRVLEAKKATTLGALEAAIKTAPPVRDFVGAVSRPGWISLIAEIKRKSPSAGLIRNPFDPERIAAEYERGGAAALSVLTEPDRFGGELADIPRARKGSSLPILRKDFVFDPYQIAEARAHGADAVLLIADMLEHGQLQELAAAAKRYGVAMLVEIFTAEVLDSALDTGAQLIGINTRNLRTLEMRPDNLVTLAPHVPNDRYVVAESGIRTAQDVIRLRALPIFAMLVGESLLKQPNLETAARALVDAGRPA